MGVKPLVFLVLCATVGVAACVPAAPSPPSGSSVTEHAPSGSDDASGPDGSGAPASSGGSTGHTNPPPAKPGGSGPSIGPSTSAPGQPSVATDPPPPSPDGHSGADISLGASFVCKNRPCVAMDFGIVTVGSTRTMSVTVINNSGLVITDVSVTGPTAFELIGGPSNSCLGQPPGLCSFDVRFQPRLGVAYKGTAHVTVPGTTISGDLVGRGSCASPCVPEQPGNHPTATPSIKQTTG